MSREFFMIMNLVSVGEGCETIHDMMMQEGMTEAVFFLEYQAVRVFLGF